MLKYNGVGLQRNLFFNTKPKGSVYFFYLIKVEVFEFLVIVLGNHKFVTKGKNNNIYILWEKNAESGK